MSAARRPLPRAVALVAAAIALALAAGAGYQAGHDGGAPSFPKDGSLEAGFARDMSVHHAQAVAMAEIERDRTSDESLRLLATDIALTQQAQIGQMRGWLDVWGLRPTSTRPAMEWMGHTGQQGPSAGTRMPGMATPHEVGSLRLDDPATAERTFLRLMIRHHQGGLQMAEQAAAESDRREVRVLAEAMVSSQRSEIEAMQAMLTKLGEQPELEDDPGHAHQGQRPRANA